MTTPCAQCGSCLDLAEDLRTVAARMALLVTRLEQLEAEIRNGTELIVELDPAIVSAQLVRAVKES